MKNPDSIFMFIIGGIFIFIGVLLIGCCLVGLIPITFGSISIYFGYRIRNEEQCDPF